MKDQSELYIFCGHYLPGFKAGGILRTVANMVDNMSSRMNLKVVTRDRDHGSNVPYENIKVNSWTKFKNEKIYYFSKEKMNIFSISNFFNNNKKQIFFFNSFFEKFTVYYFISSFFIPFLTKKEKIFLAPRGEFLDGCLNINKNKKLIYLYFFRLAYNPKNVHWIFSDKYEYVDFKQKFPIKIKMYSLLRDIPTIYPFESKPKDKLGKTDKLKLVYIARISPEKNLDIAIEIVQNTKRSIDFDIYGPISDIKYWNKCLKMINKKTLNKINYLGELLPNQVSETFSQHHIFLYPTGGDNFGHTIAESISQGTPVLISENSPWDNLQKMGWGWIIPLKNLSNYCQVLEDFKIEDSLDNHKKRKEIRKSLLEHLDLESLIEQHLKVFNE